MAELIPGSRKLVVKLVYYGPALSGKTTNLMRLHDSLECSGCGELMSLETSGDRTLFFDLLPLSVQGLNGFTIKFKLFTVPGQVAHDATRKAVLSRADGVVFVADSRNSQAFTNFESFENLEKNAHRVGLDFDKLPLVIQFNKRDLENITDENELLKRWSFTGLPLIFSSALKNAGVKETFGLLLKHAYRHLDIVYGLSENCGIAETTFLQVVSGKEG